MTLSHRLKQIALLPILVVVALLVIAAGGAVASLRMNRAAEALAQSAVGFQALVPAAAEAILLRTPSTRGGFLAQGEALAAVPSAGASDLLAPNRTELEMILEHARFLWNAPVLDQRPPETEESALLRRVAAVAEQAVHTARTSNQAVLAFASALLLGGALAGAVTAVALAWFTVRRVTRLVTEFEALRRALLGITAGADVVDEAACGELAEFLAPVRSLTAGFRQRERALAAEVEQYRKASDSARKGNTQLSDALARLKRAQDEIVRQQRAMAIEQVARGIVHDFNSALTPVLMSSDYMLKYADRIRSTEQMQEHLRMIRDAAQKAKDGVRHLSDYLRPLATGTPMPINLPDVLRDTVDALAPELAVRRSRYAPCRIELECASVPQIPMEPSDLAAAVAALIRNAAEAMPAGGTIRVTCTEDDGDIRIEVRDSGKGMPPEELERCTEPFFSTKGEHHTGMGLTRALGVARRAGGSITLTCPSGGGTIVTMVLPIPRRGAAPSPVVRRLPFATESGKPRVLVVDDEYWCAEVLRRALDAEGFPVEAANTGHAAIEKAEHTAFDIVVVDRYIPDLPGDQVAARLKQLRPAPRVIMLTGFGAVMQANDDIPAGVDTVLAKPVTIDELLEAIARFSQV